MRRMSRSPGPLPDDAQGRGKGGKELVESTFKLGFITPVFGGGVMVEGHKKPFDPVTPVRAPSIRGQLRFWWRAMNPRGCKTIEQLRKGESEVFGSTEEAGSLRISVRGTATPVPFEVLKDKFEADNDRSGLAYGAFPLRDSEQSGSRHGTLWDYGRQELEVRLVYLSHHKKDVMAAAWAFSRFGGLGGRTRRGFGAVRLSGELSPSAPTGGAQLDWPHLPATGFEVCGHTEREEGWQALERLLGAFKAFRQDRHGKEALRRPGRSRWPEPDEIRRRTRKSAVQHAEPLSQVTKFSRGAFGMPIIFHFKDRGDPPDTTLVPSGSKRWASMLILRPVPAKDKFVPAAVRLHHPAPEGFRLVAPSREHKVRIDLTPEEASHIEPLRGDPDPLSAFMKIVEEKL